MCQGVLDEVMVNTAKSIGKVQPTNTEALASTLSLPEGGQELEVVF